MNNPECDPWPASRFQQSIFFRLSFGAGGDFLDQRTQNNEGFSGKGGVGEESPDPKVQAATTQFLPSRNRLDARQKSMYRGGSEKIFK